MKTHKLIYALCCPFTQAIHYIGKTTKGMTRPLQHLTKSHSKKVMDWVEELKMFEKTPVVNVLEHVHEVDDLDGRERYWIQYRLNKGDLLLNDCLVTPLVITPTLDEILTEQSGNDVRRIAKFLKEKRKEVKLTQEEFASKAGVALTVIRKIEQGKSNVSFDGLLQTLKIFGCTVEVTRLDKMSK